jgi:hypothetical protein
MLGLLWLQRKIIIIIIIIINSNHKLSIKWLVRSGLPIGFKGKRKKKKKKLNHKISINDQVEPS